MTKELRKVILNRWLETTNEESKRHSNCQTNFCVSLLSKTQRRFLGKIDHRVVHDNKIFLKTVGPLFSEKAFPKESIILNNINETVSNNEELTETFNKHFSKLEKILELGKTLASSTASSDITDPVFNAIKKYENNPSIKY